MGAEESSVQQQEPLIPQQPNQQNIANGPIDIPQNEPLQNEPPPNKPKSILSQTDTKSPSTLQHTQQQQQPESLQQKQPIEQPKKQPEKEEKKEKEEKEKKEEKEVPEPQTTNPYIDERLTKAQTDFSLSKNKEFEQKHQIDSIKYLPEKAPMDVKQEIEEYFHTSYPIHITEDVFNAKSDLIRLRRYFHANPELSWQEIETASNISNYCSSLGLSTKTGVGKTGVVAVLHGAFSDGLCIGLRADMDALPIHEENNDIAYKSRVSGVSHACGHDCHMAILLTVARILSQPKYVAKLHGSVKFIFQPAEEGGAGAKYMIEDGVLRQDEDCPAVDQVYGLHVWSYLKLPKIVLKYGALMAGSVKFIINVKGVGGHGAEPKGTSDTVLALTQLSIELHSIVSRDISPIDCGVLTIGTMNVGSGANIIAECGDISGTIRYLDNSVFSIIKSRMESLCKGMETSYGVIVSIVWGNDPYPPVINDIECVDNVKNAVNKVFPISENVMIDSNATMAAEDFSFYLNQVNGCFFFIGCGVDDNEMNGPHKVLRNIECGDEKKTKIYAHHTPTFRVDERCLIVAVQIMVNLVMDLLIKSK